MSSKWRDYSKHFDQSMAFENLNKSSGIGLEPIDEKPKSKKKKQRKNLIMEHDYSGSLRDPKRPAAKPNLEFASWKHNLQRKVLAQRKQIREHDRQQREEREGQLSAQIERLK